MFTKSLVRIKGKEIGFPSFPGYTYMLMFAFIPSIKKGIIKKAESPNATLAEIKLMRPMKEIFFKLKLMAHENIRYEITNKVIMYPSP